jgi:alanine-glyoxylate transaminase / serine-glyoxylate transaminase / serine-pyruvate transaminase
VQDEQTRGTGVLGEWLDLPHVVPSGLRAATRRYHCPYDRMSEGGRVTPGIDPRKLPDLPELMIAGPGELHDEDRDALGQQVLAHYGDFWTQFHSETIGLLGDLLDAADPPYLVPGTGSTCLDAAVMNLFEPGQRVVVPATGFFGTRLAQIAAASRLDVVDVPVEVGRPVEPERVADAARGAHGVLTVHAETATGVRHPIEAIAAAAHDAGAAVVVDGISSVGGELIEVDGMGLDAVVTSTQKGLDAPPGLGVVALSAGGRERVEGRSERPNSWYLDLKTWDWYRKEWGSWHPHPVTMPTNLVLALNSSLRRILERGARSWVEDRARLATRCRAGLIELGLKSVPEAGHETNLVVAMWADDPVALQKHLLEDHHIMISGGLPPTAGKAIRVGLMGRTATGDMVDRVIAGIAEALH